MAYTTRIDWEPLRSINSAALTGGYDALGTPLANPSYLLKVINNSTQDVFISKDGATDIDVVPAGSFFLYDETKTTKYEMVAARTQIYVKGTAGVGTIYLVTQYLVVG